MHKHTFFDINIIYLKIVIISMANYQQYFNNQNYKLCNIHNNTSNDNTTIIIGVRETNYKDKKNFKII